MGKASAKVSSSGASLMVSGGMRSFLGQERASTAWAGRSCVTIPLTEEAGNGARPMREAADLSWAVAPTPQRLDHRAVVEITEAHRLGALQDLFVRRAQRQFHSRLRAGLTD